MANEKSIQIAAQNSKSIKAITNNVLSSINAYTKSGELQIPPNYSVSNALKQMQLIIVDDEKLMACTPASLSNMMLDMVILGLNPGKDQCYPIAYGDTAKLMPSYFGNKMLAMRICPNIKDIVAKPIKKGEEFEYENNLEDGYATILKHKSTLESLDSKEFIGGYATIIYNDGSKKSLVMTFSRILESWKMSQAKPFDENGNLKSGSVHSRFTEDMIQRTLINAITKPIIKSSDDKDLFSSTLHSVYLENSKANSESNIKNNISSETEVIDIDETELEVDQETGEVLE